MANLQPMAPAPSTQAHVIVQGGNPVPNHYQPPANSLIPYHIYHNVVLAALQDVKPAIKSELEVTADTQQNDLFKHYEVPPVSSADLIKTEYGTGPMMGAPTAAAPNTALLNPPQHIIQQSGMEMSSVSGSEVTALPLQPIQTPPHQQHHHQQPQQPSQLQFLLPALPNLSGQPLENVQSTQVSTASATATGKKKRQKNPKNLEKVHHCTQCPYVCNRADKLKVHIKGVHNNDKPFACEFCGKGFKQRDKLSRHTNTVHFRERPFACDYCPLAFGRKDKVKRHVSTVHLMERPYRCNFCSHNTTRKDKMRIHLQQVHQSIDGSEHYIIERQSQPPPRVLQSNKNRNIGDAITTTATTTASVAAAAAAPAIPATSTAASTTPPTAESMLPPLPDLNPTLVNHGMLPQLSLAPVSTDTSMSVPNGSLVSLAPGGLVTNVTNLVAQGTFPANSTMLQLGTSGEENSQNAINNLVPLKVVTKM